MVARIAADLRALDIPVWWDKWEIGLGDSLTAKIQAGIQDSGYLCVSLSPNSVRSDWVQRELTAGLVRELESKRVFVLPLLLAHCDIPLFLRDKLYANFITSYEDGFNTLVARVAPRIDPEICTDLMDEDPLRIEGAVRRIPDENRATYTNWLRSRLSSEHATERRSSVIALHQLSPSDMLASLLAVAKDHNPSIRRLVAIYLGEIRGTAPVSALQELTQDKAPEVRAAARSALRKIGH